ncbi:MAG TPA: TonB-dependent receptor [Burkholderiaceae bacterium]
MKTKLTPIAAAAAVVFAGAATPAFAQSAAAPASAASAAAKEDVQRVEVTGIRASLQTSINQKRNAESHVEVITAEDIGKLPDKNVADSLAHVPGVTISSAGANEGGFDESDRVSMRGTSPSLTQTLINGHNVATGDWFVLDQTGTVGRSVSYTLLPTEIVSSVVVHKSSEASLVEGGVAGSVDIITRKPLEFSKPLSAAVSVGAVYAQLPAKTDPQVSGLVNWKNEAGTLGVLIQGFYEKRHLRRDGIEVLGYDTIQANDASAKAGLPGLTAGVKYPDLIGDALFLQERKRTGGLIDVEMKPNSVTTLDLNGFMSDMTATNINRNYMFFGRKLGGGQVPTEYTVDNGYLTSATYSNSAGMMAGIYDQIARPKEGSHSQYLDFDGKFQLTDKFNLKTQIGFSSGYGKTPEQDVAETVVGSTGASFKLNGPTSAANFGLGNATYNSQGSVGLNDTFNTDSGDGWIFGDQNLKVKDGEQWAQLDAEYDVEVGPLVDIKFGGRGAQHTRSLWGVIGQGPTVDWSLPDLAAACANGHDFRCIPAASGNYPSNFANGLTSAIPHDMWTFSPAQLAAYDAKFTNRDPITRADYGADYGLRETDTAGYIQGDLEGNKWSGNFGLRIVNTKEQIQNYVAHATAQPGDVTTSAFGNFALTTTTHSYTDLLPSLNLKFDLSKDMVARFAASRTMTRADYSQLAGSVSLGAVDDVNLIGTGSGGNPDLKPITSNNADLSFEWYFAPRALLSASLFYMDVTSYIGLSPVHRTYTYTDNAHPNGVPVDFTLTVPNNISAKVHGVELAWQQPVWGNFGVDANYAFTTSSTADGSPMVGTSKNTYNVGGYFENDFLNARVTWNHRSAFYSGLDRATAYYQGAAGDLTASVGWTFNKNFNVTLDGRNLNNPKLRYYEQGGQPRAIYENGRQFYLTAHVSY